MLTNRDWTLTSIDVQSRHWTGSILRFTSQVDTGDNAYQVEGYFDWISEGTPRGRELFRGTLDANRHLSVDGYELQNPVGIGLASYRADLTSDGNGFINGTWDGHGIVPGTWSVAAPQIGTLGVTSFSGAGVSSSNEALSRSLAIRYTIRNVADSFDLAIVSTDQTAYTSGGNIVKQWNISPAAITGSNGALRLLNEAPSRALANGSHTLLVEADAALSAALADSLVSYLFAVVDPADTEADAPEDNAVVFRGLFQDHAGGRLVARTGSASTDLVSITGTQDRVAVSIAGAAIGGSRFTQKTTGSVLATDVLVVTGDANDVIQTSAGVTLPTIVRAGTGDDELALGGGNVDLAGGPGSDTYRFPVGARGVKTIADLDASAGATDIDTLDFFGLSSSVTLNLTTASQQTVAENLALQLVDPNGIEVVLGSEFDDHVVGNDEKNALIGRGGNDELDGAGEVDLLLGDGFGWKMPQWRQFIQGVFNLDVPLLMVSPNGTGADTLRGGPGFDVIVGGDGNDQIEGSDGGGLYFGDAFQMRAKIGPSLDLQTVVDNPRLSWTELLGWIGLPTFGLAGAGNDTVVGGSGVDLAVGGSGKDDITLGGGILDIAFGNNDADRLDLSASRVGILIGGSGNDTLLGPSAADSVAGLLLGDGFRFVGLPRLGFDFDLDSAQYTLELAAGLLADGNGDDVLQSAATMNVLIGGNGHDRLTASGAFALTMGDAFNVGASLTLNLHSLYSNDSLVDDLQLPGLTGNGNDRIDVDSVVSVALGGAGHDVINAGPATRTSVLLGGDHNDSIKGGAAAFNILVGGAGNDELIGGETFDVILGDGWRTKGQLLPLLPLRISDLRDQELTASSPIMPIGNGRDTLVGNAGFDILIGGDGDDRIDGGSGFNLMLGDSFSLATNVSIGVAVLLSNPFDDVEFKLQFTLIGSGSDQLIGGADKDLAVGGGGSDLISTGEGNDAIFGGDGNDILLGGSDSDLIFGNNGDDFLNGESGTDYLRGGAGRDWFLFDTVNLSWEDDFWDYDPARDR